VRARLCAICLSFRSLGLCIFSNVNVQKRYCVSLSIHSSPKRGILGLDGQESIHVLYITGIYCKFLPSKFYS